MNACTQTLILWLYEHLHAWAYMAAGFCTCAAEGRQAASTMEQVGTRVGPSAPQIRPLASHRQQESHKQTNWSDTVYASLSSKLIGPWAAGFFSFLYLKKLKFQKYMAVPKNFKTIPLSPPAWATGACRPLVGRQDLNVKKNLHLGPSAQGALNSKLVKLI